MFSDLHFLHWTLLFEFLHFLAIFGFHLVPYVHESTFYYLKFFLLLLSKRISLRLMLLPHRCQFLLMFNHKQLAFAYEFAFTLYLMFLLLNCFELLHFLLQFLRFLVEPLLAKDLGFFLQVEDF